MLSWLSVTIVAISMIRSLSVSKPVISKSIQIRFCSLYMAHLNIIELLTPLSADILNAVFQDIDQCLVFFFSTDGNTQKLLDTWLTKVTHNHALLTQLCRQLTGITFCVTSKNKVSGRG